MFPRFLNIAIGVWLMASPAVLGYVATPAEVSQRIVGPFIATFAAVAIWEGTRSVRLWNRGPALWLLAAPLLLPHTTPAAVNSLLCGLAILLITFLGRHIEQHFGGGWASLFKHQPEHAHAEHQTA